MTRARGWWLLVAMVGAVPAARAAVPPPARVDPWVEVTTPHFVVISNAGADAATGVGRRLEHLTEVLGRTHSGLRASVGERTRVYAFATEASFGYYHRPRVENLAGYFMRTRGPGFIAFILNAHADSPDQTLYHEFTHAFLSYNLRELPEWLNEGLACYYSSFRPGEQSAEIGRPVKELVAWAGQTRYFTLDELFRFDQEGPLDRDSPRRRAFYADSWAIVHFMLHGSDANRDGFEWFLEGLRRGDDPRRAFESAFPTVEWPALVERTRMTTAAGEFQFARFQFGEPLGSSDVTVTRLDRAQALVRLGELMQVARDDAPELAADHYRTALQEDPRAGVALAHLGEIEDRAGHAAKADSSYARAAALAPEDARVFAIAGHGILARVPRGISPRDPARVALVRRAREAFARSLAIEPGHFDALQGFGQASVLTGQASDPGLHALAQAFAMHPERDDLEANLTTLAVRDTGSELARRVVAHALKEFQSPGAYKRAGHRRVEVALTLAGNLNAARRTAEAQSVVDRVIAEAPEASDRERARSVQARLRGDRRTLTSIDLYNQGIRDLNARRLTEALKAFETVRAGAPTEELRRAAAARIQEIGVQRKIDDALALANRGQLAQSRAALTALLGQPISARQDAYVRRLIGELDATRH